MNDKKYDILKENIIAQAKYYLDNSGEFFPFGAIIDQNHNLKPIGAYFGRENPTSIEVINHLDRALKRGIEKEEYILGAIGVDVFINSNKSYGKERKTALEIRIYDATSMFKYYFLYFKENDKYFFKEYTEI